MGALAGGDALLRLLDPVVGRVADHVGERIADHLEKLAVQLGVGALHHQLDALAELRGKVAQKTRQLRPGIADGLHPRLMMLSCSSAVTWDSRCKGTL